MIDPFEIPDHGASAPIVTARLVLRPPCADDLGELVRLADNPAVAAMLARMPHPYGEAEGRAFIENLAPAARGCVFALLHKERFVGCASIEANAEGRLELGYWLGQPHWGKGFATEAAQALIDRAFTTMGAAELAANCRVANDASRRVLHKSGFQYAGQGMRDTLLSGRVAMEIYRLDRRVWAGLKSWGK